MQFWIRGLCSELKAHCWTSSLLEIFLATRAANLLYVDSEVLYDICTVQISYCKWNVHLQWLNRHSHFVSDLFSTCCTCPLYLLERMCQIHMVYWSQFITHNNTGSVLVNNTGSLLVSNTSSVLVKRKCWKVRMDPGWDPTVGFFQGWLLLVLLT